MSLIIRAVFTLLCLILLTIVSFILDYHSLPSTIVLFMKNNLPKSDPLPTYFSPPSPDLRSFILNAKLKIRPQDTNLTKKSPDDCNLVVIVTSSLNNSEARKAIRETWGQLVDKYGQKLYFLVGETYNPDGTQKPKNGDNVTQQHSTNDQNNHLNLDIENEALLYGDIIQYVFIDSYFNLTLKSLLMMRFLIEELLELNVSEVLRVGEQSYNNSKNLIKQVFLMKTDEDMFIQMENLVVLTRKLTKYLNKVSDKPLSLLTGHLIKQAQPIRSKNNKYYMPSDVYREHQFPDYLSGTAYLSTSNAIINIFIASLTNKCRYLHLEDICLTGLCASKVGIKRYNHSGFKFFKVDPKDICFYKSAITISSHNLSPNELRQVWNGLSLFSNKKIDCNNSTKRPEPRKRIKQKRINLES